MGSDGLAVQPVGGVEGQGGRCRMDLTGLLLKYWQA